MRLFRKRNKEIKENLLQDKVAGKIALVFIKAQGLFAAGMNNLFSSMNRKQIKLWLFSFCFVSGGLSIYFFIEALVSNPKAAIKVEQVRMPQHFDKTGDEVMENEMSGEIFLQIQDYRKYMDSMGIGIPQGLEDSLRVIEEIYLQQKNE